jgi:hypothetical protein
MVQNQGQVSEGLFSKRLGETPKVYRLRQNADFGEYIKTPLFDHFSENLRFSLSTMRPGFCLGSPKRAQKGRKKTLQKPDYAPVTPRSGPSPERPLFDPFLTPFLRPAKSVWAR